MRGFLFSAVMTALLPLAAKATGGPSNPDSLLFSNQRLDSTVVVASRAGSRTPVAHTTLNREELRQGSPLNSLPMSLNLQPSVVSVNEGGTGLGYSKLTVRGSKGSQINVTLNGITLNDAESQEVFWVNLPSLANLLSSVQLQRGLGTSASGAGAFGASINMSTAGVGKQPYARADLSAGSYNTFMATVSAGTGLTRSGVYFDAAYSRNYTNGYIRNAKANLQSAYAVLGWLRGSNSLKLTYLMGDQHTGITWNGIDLQTYATDRRYNGAGEYRDDLGNLRYYDNETDNFTQHHLQANYVHQFPCHLAWSTTLNFTKGDGYCENYKMGKKFSKYGFREDFSHERDGMIYDMNSRGDFIVRKSMDTYYLVLNSELRYAHQKVSAVGGVNLSRYLCKHFGELLWSDVLGENWDYKAWSQCGKQNGWYFNTGLKQEVNIFARAEYQALDWLTAYLDLQWRGVWLRMRGVEDEDDLPLDHDASWQFFNPRAGLTFSHDRHKAYASAALGGREPGRSDIKEVIYSLNSGDGSAKILPEKMVDVEFGYEYASPKVHAVVNFYFMEYFDMLLETGRLSQVGYPIKENVGRAWRRGVELSAAWRPLRWLDFQANLTLSRNIIRRHSEYIFDAEHQYLYQVQFGKTKMLMSPSVVGMFALSFRPFVTFAKGSLRTTALNISGKYVGKQHVDNTQVGVIPGYYVMDLSLSHEFDLRKGKLGLGVYVSNLLNNKYYADGISWGKTLTLKEGASSGDVISAKDCLITNTLGIYPQAPANFMVKLTFSF